MRHLANELGGAPMALYYHVRDKDELLLFVLEAQAQHIPRPEFPDDPRERLIAAAVTLYELLAERPWIVEVLIGDNLIAPSALWIVEVLIGAGIEYGHTPDQAVYIYRTIWYYIVGDLIIRINSKRRHTRTGTPIYRDQVFAELAASAHPHLAALAGHWTELTARDTHREGLTALIDGLLQAPTATRPNETDR